MCPFLQPRTFLSLPGAQSQKLALLKFRHRWVWRPSLCKAAGCKRPAEHRALPADARRACNREPRADVQGRVCSVFCAAPPRTTTDEKN